jgi:C4-dicarboxylate-specific signal transduction histidine kinase
MLEKQRLQDAEIDRRAQVLADQIIANRKKVEEKVYGSKIRTADLFQQEKEEEERKSYEDTFKDTFKKIENERLQKDNEEIVQVRALASLGLIVSSFSHELKEIKNNADDIIDLKEGVENLVPPDLKLVQEYKDVQNIISSLAADTRKIVHWIEYSLNAIKKDKRKRMKLNLSDYFDSLQKDWVSLLLERNISLHIHKDKDTEFFLQAFEMDMNTIFSNLISNSIDAFDNLKIIRARIIKISMKKDANFLEILFNDNGPGLSKYFDSDRESIFQPFVTSKIDGHGKEIGIGLGMYLVKNVMDDYKGLINILDEEPGFHLKLFFPLRKN